MRLSFVVLAVLIGSIVLAGCGAMPPASEQITSSSQAQPTPSIPPDVAVLQAQLEEMRRSDDALLSTVYWSLGFVAVFVVVVLGVNLVVLNTRYEHDKREMRDAILNELKNDQKARLRFQEIRAVRRQRAFERKIRTGQAKSFLSLQKSTLDMGEYLLRTTREVEQETYKAHYNFLHHEIHRMIDPEVLRDAGLGPVSHKLLNAAVLLDHEPGISYALEMMIRSIEKGPMDRESTVTWWEDLNALPPKYSAYIERIKQLLAEQPSTAAGDVLDSLD